LQVLVVGSGKVGSEIARDLARSSEVDSVIVADAQQKNLKSVRGYEKIRTRRLDISQRKPLLDTMRRVDLICGALPGRLGFQLMTYAVEAHRDLVDISYTPENPFKLHSRAGNQENIVVPQCGVAPGFTNMCVGDAARRLGTITKVRVFVGGLPQKPTPPLNYRIVFSLEDVINEYSRPARIIQSGKEKMVDALSGRGFLNFPGVGRLEYFITDGLGSLPRSFPRVREMFEYTLRYPGHAEMINTLRILGFFDKEEVQINGSSVVPRKLSIALMRGSMSLGRPEDLLALRVEVEGPSGKKSLLSYRILDYYDPKSKVSAMARTTAYPCTSIALLVGQKKLRSVGVVPPEKIAKDPSHFGFVLSRLRSKGVKVAMPST
jgi:saccharopine dehydrogenase-like NADP-dependent oxidoreductase